MAGLFQREKTVNRVVLLEVGSIRPNPAQPRTVFDPEALTALAESIRQNGLLQPISVRKEKEGVYELIAGERRLRAAKLAGLGEIPAIILEATPQESAVLALLENLQRRDLNFFEQAAALAAAITEWNITQEEAAARLSMAQSTVANKIRLARIPLGQQELILEGGLTERHARALLKLTDNEREEAIREIIRRRYNVAQTEKYIETLQKPQEKKLRLPVIKDVRIFLNTIDKALGVMKSAGVPAESEKHETPGYIEYIVRIPR